MIQKTDLFWSVIVQVVPTAMSVLNVDARSALPGMWIWRRANMWLMNVVNAIIRHRVAIIILRVNISMIIRSLAARKITRRNM